MDALFVLIGNVNLGQLQWERNHTNENYSSDWWLVLPSSFSSASSSALFYRWHWKATVEIFLFVFLLSFSRFDRSTADEYHRCNADWKPAIAFLARSRCRWCTPECITVSIRNSFAWYYSARRTSTGDMAKMIRWKVCVVCMFFVYRTELFMVV